MQCETAHFALQNGANGTAIWRFLHGETAQNAMQNTIFCTSGGQKRVTERPKQASRHSISGKRKCVFFRIIFTAVRTGATADNKETSTQ